MGNANPIILDVREIPPRERHPKIFGTIDGLQSGESVVIINDHDPKPLLYQLDAERKGLFEWEYLAEGPEEWKVEISRK